MSQIQNAYLDAKVGHEILEQQIRQCQDAVLLPGLNFQLEQSAIALQDKFRAWNVEVNEFINRPIVPEIEVTRHLSVVGWHQAEDINQTPGAA